MFNLQRYQKNDLVVCLVIFCTTLAVYLWSMPRTVVLEDDGLFLLTAYYNGIAHPPGYPLYTLLSHLATWVPIGSIAERVHAFTAMLGALCCVCLYRVIRQLLPGIHDALVASLVFGFSLAFWSQSIIAEVYSLNVLIVLLLLHLSLMYAAAHDLRQQQRLLNWMGLLYGLGLSNHWPLLVLSTPLFLVVLFPYWRNVLQQFSRGTLFGLLGLTPYLWMVWRTQMDPLISFYGPINDWQEFWSFISRKMFAGVEQSPTAGWEDKLAFSWYALVETSRQFTWAGTFLVIIGFLSQWKQWRWPITTGLVLGYLGNTFILIGLLGLDYDYLSQSNFRPCPLVAYAVCSIWLALGLKVSVEWMLNQSKSLVRPELLRKATGTLVIILPLMVNAADNYRATDVWAEDYAKLVLDSLEHGAILFTHGDTDVWTIGYIHHVLGYRPDVTLYCSKGIVFSNRLFKPYTIRQADAEAELAKFVNTTSSPVYSIAGFSHNYGETDFGIFTRIDKQYSKERQRAIVLPGIRQYFEKLLHTGEPIDNWEKIHYRVLVAVNCLQSVRMYNTALLHNVISDSGDWAARICNNFQAKMQYAGYLLNLDSADMRLPGLLAEAERLKHQAIARSELIRLEEYRQRLDTAKR